MIGTVDIFKDPILAPLQSRDDIIFVYPDSP